MKLILTSLIFFLLTSCVEEHPDQSIREDETSTFDSESNADKDSTLSNVAEIPAFYK